MPKLLRVRLCNIGPHRARMEDLTLNLEDVVTGQATHSAIWLRNGGGKTTLISLLLWLLCPDKPMPDKNQIDDYVQPDDRSVLLAEWQMDQPPTLWTGKPERYLTGAFCEWKSSASQEGKKLERFFFAARIIEDEPRFTLEHFPLFLMKQEHRERRSLANFRQEWKELDHTYPQAEVEYTDKLSVWREVLERIGVDPELFRYQIRMNTREGGAAEPFMFKENERFIDFFLELMGEAAIGNDIALTIKEYRQELLYLRQQIEPEYHLLQTLTQQFALLCEIADERDRLYQQIRSIQQDINQTTFAIKTWKEQWQQKREAWIKQEEQAHAEHTRQKEEAGQRRRRALFLRYSAAQKYVSRLQTNLEALQELVQDKKRQETIWKAAIPLLVYMRSRAKAEDIDKQLAERLQEHEPLLHTLQASARSYAAALSARARHLREEEQRLGDLAREQRLQSIQFSKQATDQLLAAKEYDSQAQRTAEELASFRTRQKHMEEQGVMLPGELWVQAQKRLLQQQSEWQEEQRVLEGHIDTLEHEQQAMQKNLNFLISTLSSLMAQITLEERMLQPAQQAREQIAADLMLRQYLEVTELDFDRLTPQALEIVRNELETSGERNTRLRLLLTEQKAMIEYLSAYGYLPPAQAVAQVLELLKKEHITAWSGWQYLAESIRETERRSWIERLPELAFGIVLPDEQWEEARSVLQAHPPYLETPVVVFARRDIHEQVFAQGWTIGPTSDAYFNTHSGNQELAEREERYKQQKQHLNDLIHERTILQRSFHLLEHTFEQYPTSWWENHQQALGEAEKQKSATEEKKRTQEQELLYGKGQIAARKEESRQLKARLQSIQQKLMQLQVHEAQLTIDFGALQEKENRLRAQANFCRDEARQWQRQAEDKDSEANDTFQKEKRVASEAGLIEQERSEIKYLESEPPATSSGDMSLLRDHYQSLLEQYQQQIGADVLIVRRDDVLRDAQNAYRQFEKKAQKSVSEQEVRDALNTLNDPDEVEQRAEDASVARMNAEHERKSEQERLTLAEKELAENKKKLTLQGIDENEGMDNIPESEDRCTAEAEEEERLAASAEQAAQQQRIAEQTAQQQSKECALRIDNLGRVQQQIRTIQNRSASLLNLVLSDEIVPASAKLDTLATPEEEQVTFQEEDIDGRLQMLENRLDQFQEEKAKLDRRSKSVTHIILRALQEANRDYKEVSLATRFLEHEETAYEQHCRVFLAELNDRLRWVQEERANLLVHRDTLVQQLLALAEAGIAFLSSATKYSRLPATLPAFEQRPFLRIHLTELSSREERIGKVADLLDTIVKDKDIPSGIELLQQVVRRLASPMNVQILFPDPAALQYVAPTRMMKESGGERLTSMVLLYCTLLRMRAAYRAKPAGKSSCLILDNPLGVASRALFLELQREVAQAMDIQLIYTTAIKDFEALHIFPNIIRLRNDQRDRRTGNQLLMLDTNPGGLEALRVMHSDTRDFLQERQERQS